MKAPLPFVVGAVIVKGAFPKVFAGTEKSVRTVVALLTTSDEVIVADA